METLPTTPAPNEVQQLLQFFGVTVSNDIHKSDKFKEIVAKIIDSGEGVPTGYRVQRVYNKSGSFQAHLIVYSPEAHNTFMLHKGELTWIITGVIYKLPVEIAVPKHTGHNASDRENQTW